MCMENLFLTPQDQTFISLFFSTLAYVIPDIAQTLYKFMNSWLLLIVGTFISNVYRTRKLKCKENLFLVKWWTVIWAEVCLTLPFFGISFYNSGVHRQYMIIIGINILAWIARSILIFNATHKLSEFSFKVSTVTDI